MGNIRIVTEVESLDKKRSKIFINQEFAFVLYQGEIRKYKIQIQKEIPENLYYMIVQEILPKRAKKRCLGLLQIRPYTEKKLREKLKEGYYSQEVIEEAIKYVKSYHYIDDYQYACDYIFYHKECESRRKMEEKLMMKGVSKEILEQAFYDSFETEEEQQELEILQAKKLLEKKQYHPEHMDWKEKRKIYSFLIRKGIRSEVVGKVMSLDMV